tara:strand:+ start:532 stop:1425 length:894 start_codon:yes stop_codon:yes gene_type:complete
MKALQTQFNLIKEGKGHKDVFVKEAKRLFPDIIPNSAGFDQTSTLLKNKNIIAENVFPLIPSSGLNPFSTFDKFLKEEVKETKAEEKKTSKEVEEDLSKIYDIYDKKNLDNQIFDQVLNGIRFELEQDSELSLDEATEKVRKNLAKNSLHYLENAAFGVKGLGYTKEAPGLGEPKELKGKYKSSGYGDLKENKMKLIDLLKEGAQEDLKEADKIGEVAALEAKINFIEGKIKKCYETMTIFERDDVKEFVDKKRQGQIKKEVKLLERAKVQLEKRYDKLKGTVEEMDDTIDESDYDY